MRKLQTHDIFMALKVINAAQIKDEVKRIAMLTQNGKQLKVKEVGVEFILGCLEKISGTEAEQSIYELLSGPMQIEAEEIKTMDPFDLVDKIEELGEFIGKDKIKNFFKRVADLMTKVQS